MLSFYQFPPEDIDHSLVTWLNGESKLYTHPMHQVMFLLHLADVSHGRCSADLHCLFRYGEQRVSGKAKHKWCLNHTSRLCGFQGQWRLYTRSCDSSEKICKMSSPGKWLHLAFCWPYCWTRTLAVSWYWTWYSATRAEDKRPVALMLYLYLES